MITIFKAGQFGDAVAQSLASRYAETSVIFDVLSPTFDQHKLEDSINASRFVAGALWRPYISICRRIDDICHKVNVSWSIAEIDGSTVRIGPLIRPGKGPCYDCFRRRYMSHHAAPMREEVLQQAYDKSAALGCPGFIYPAVQIAESFLYRNCSDGSLKPGLVTSVGLLSGEMSQSIVIGVHGCAKCMKDITRYPGSRYVEYLIPILARYQSE